MALRTLVVLVALAVVVPAVGCVIQSDPQTEQELALRVPGRYVAVVDGQPFEMVLHGDGSGTLNGQPGQWAIQLGTLMLSDGQQWVPASLEGGTLTVQMPDGTVVFQRDDGAAVAGAEGAPAGSEEPSGGELGGVQGGGLPAGPSADENLELRGRLVGCWEDYSHSGGNTGSASFQSTLRLGEDGSYARRVYSSAFVGGTSVVNDETETGRFQVVGDSLRLSSDGGQVSDLGARLEGGILYLNNAKHLPCS